MYRQASQTQTSKLEAYQIASHSCLMMRRKSVCSRRTALAVAAMKLELPLGSCACRLHVRGLVPLLLRAHLLMQQNSSLRSREPRGIIKGHLGKALVLSRVLLTYHMQPFIASKWPGCNL